MIGKTSTLQSAWRISVTRVDLTGITQDFRSSVPDLQQYCTVPAPQFRHQSTICVTCIIYIYMYIYIYTHIPHPHTHTHAHAPTHTHTHTHTHPHTHTHTHTHTQTDRFLSTWTLTVDPPCRLETGEDDRGLPVSLLAHKSPPAQVARD